jgi:putative nucleotidyltransferase with HDIG domain
VAFRHAVGRAEDQVTHLASVNRVYAAAIEALAHAVDAKDQVTHDHTRRVQDQTLRLARALGVEDESELNAIGAAALLHDVGKLAVPEHILNKPGRLTAAEYEIMKRHAPIGADILSVIGFPYAVAPIVRHHHENWDGTGYPDGIAGSQIPIGSRILSVVDCFDALTSDRPYRPHMTDRDALAILRDRRGGMYDPQVVDAFFALQEQADLTARPESRAAVEAAAPAERLEPEPREARLEEAWLQTLFELGRSTAGCRSMPELGEIVWAHLRPYVPASVFVFYAYEKTSDAIVAVYRAGDEAALVSACPIRLGERLSGWVAATGETVMNSDARLDLDEAVREQSALRSALAVPLVVDGHAAGVLSVYSTAANAFDVAHRRLVEAVRRAVAGCVADIPQPAWPEVLQNETRTSRIRKNA